MFSRILILLILFGVLQLFDFGEAYRRSGGRSRRSFSRYSYYTYRSYYHVRYTRYTSYNDNVSSDSSRTAAIVGGVIGGLIFLGIVALIAYLFCKRYTSKTKSPIPSVKSQPYILHKRPEIQRSGQKKKKNVNPQPPPQPSVPPDYDVIFPPVNTTKKDYPFPPDPFQYKPPY